MKTIIFYGAGQNALNNLEKWREKGLHPVCFADSDYSKHGSVLANGLKVFSLLEAIKLYPDYELYLTQSNSGRYLKNITKKLLGFGIPVKRIKYPVGFVRRAYLQFQVCLLRIKGRILNKNSDNLRFHGESVKAIIFYGAGQNALNNLEKWGEKGLHPVCFADSDCSKHGSVLANGLKVFPLLEAINLYPDYELYLTQSEPNLGNVTEILLGLGIPSERIKYPNGFVQKKYCSNLVNNYFVIDREPTIYSYCCDKHRSVYPSSGDFDTDYQHSSVITQWLTDLQQSGFHTRCDGCLSLREGDAPKTNQRHFNLSTGLHGGHMCNFKCVYCTYGYLLKAKKPVASSIDVLDILKKIEAHFQSDDVRITYACGEIGVSKYRDEILEMWAKNRWRGHIVTNASVYSDRITALLGDGLISINCSLDAGTANTFAKVKGLDLFDAVVDNLRKYASSGGAIELKYILLKNINDNLDDIEGFFEIASSLKAKVILSSDNSVNNRVITAQEKNAALHLINKCRESGMTYWVDDFFYAVAIKEMREL